MCNIQAAGSILSKLASDPVELASGEVELSYGAAELGMKRVSSAAFLCHSHTAVDLSE